VSNGLIRVLVTNYEVYNVFGSPVRPLGLLAGPSVRIWSAILPSPRRGGGRRLVHEAICLSCRGEQHLVQFVQTSRRSGLSNFSELALTLDAFGVFNRSGLNNVRYLQFNSRRGGTVEPHESQSCATQPSAVRAGVLDTSRILARGC
jgi:hypothetical protein